MVLPVRRDYMINSHRKPPLAKEIDSGNTGPIVAGVSLDRKQRETKLAWQVTDQNKGEGYNHGVFFVSG